MQTPENDKALGFDPDSIPANRAAWRKHLYIVIFGSDTKGGKAFDIALLWSIALSVLCVTLESVSSIRYEYGAWLRAFEWLFTVLFSIEYILRIVSSPRPMVYVKSFFGIVDLCSVLPTYLSLSVEGFQGLIVIRILRLLRVFRIFKLVDYTGEAGNLMGALQASRQKIAVFIGCILTLIVIMGAAMYIVEGPASGFTSIPTSMYWSIVTLTTVGYGDITPMTPVGKIMASFIMLMGYGIIAVPTGIVSAQIGRSTKSLNVHKECKRCGETGHPGRSNYCFRCGERLPQ